MKAMDHGEGEEEEAAMKLEGKAAIVTGAGSGFGGGIAKLFAANGGGVFLTIASTAGVRPRPGLTWYNGSKGAAITITRSMAAELAPDKIRCVAINPVLGETA
jgi:NAD(P)-dependent dehydrogenase (short-subunit alcohol dehydrogenase family)